MRRCWVLFMLMAVGSQARAQTDGAALFEKHCATCHQTNGSGTVGLAPSLIGPHWRQLGKDRTYLPAVLIKGLSGAIVVNDQRFVGSMPAFAEQLDNASLAAIANHLSGLQGDANAGYADADFQTARGQTGGPPQTRIKRVKILGN